MPIYSDMLRRLRSPTPLLIVATATTILIVIPTVRLAISHNRLSKRITSHSTHTGQAAQEHLDELKSDLNDLVHPKPPLSAARLPQNLLINPRLYNLFHDLSTFAVPAATLPQHLSTHDMLTAYLQHTMTLFSSTPQAYALWALSPTEARRSFDREWIESLPFEEGGLVCGMYRVLGRWQAEDERSGCVCFGMAMNGVEGRLVIGLCKEELAGSEKGSEGKEEGVFSTETWMWVEKEKHIVMPMERKVPRLMHRLGSWWLLVSGTEWLQSLAA